jgi:hypothetical protein
MVSKKVVTPLENGVQVFCNSMKILDSGFRRNDKKKLLGLFTKLSNLDMPCAEPFISHHSSEDVDFYFDLIATVTHMQVIIFNVGVII